MLGQAGETPFDIHFSLFGIPVRIHPGFWVICLLLGWSPKDPRGMILWTFSVFVSILVHEMGHALLQRKYGYNPRIVLYLMGGYAEYNSGWQCHWKDRLKIILAGPSAGFLLYGLVELILWLIGRNDGGWVPTGAWFYHVRAVLWNMSYINLWWGIMNLLPIFPLDGGQASMILFTVGQGEHRGRRNALKLSLLVGGGIGLYFLQREQTYNGLLFISLAVQNLMSLQEPEY